MARAPRCSVLHELSSTVTAVLRERGMPPGMADSCAREIAAGFARACGGRVAYIPNRIPAVFQSRDEEIARQHNGKNTGQLARRYKISERRVWQIVRKMAGQAGTLKLVA